MTDDQIVRRTEAGVAELMLNRPESLNSFSFEMAEQLNRALAACREDDAVRVVILRGAGRVFSAGGDVKEMLANVSQGEDRAAYFRAPLEEFHQTVLNIRSLPKPVMAVVHGAVAGFAWNLVLACDLVLAQRGTRFTQAFIRLGLSPDGGGTFYLPRLVGYARACELAMLPNEIDAEEAKAWGMVNWVVAPDDLDRRSAGVANQLANGPAAALARVKALLNRQLAAELAAQLDAERDAQIKNADHDDFAEGLTAFTEKRPPSFAGAPGGSAR